MIRNNSIHVTMMKMMIIRSNRNFSSVGKEEAATVYFILFFLYFLFFQEVRVFSMHVEKRTKHIDRATGHPLPPFALPSFFLLLLFLSSIIGERAVEARLHENGFEA